MCICPRTGAIISAGGDGRILISLNGRLAAHGSEKDLYFNTCRVVMTIVRKSNEELALVKVCLSRSSEQACSMLHWTKIISVLISKKKKI